MIGVATSLVLGLLILGAAVAAHALASTSRGEVGRWLAVQQWLPRLELILVMSGSAFLAGGLLGNVVRTVIGFADGLAANIDGGQLTGQIISCAIGLAAAIALVFGLIANQVDKWTTAGALLLPVLLYAIPGPVGDWLGRGVSWVARGIGDLFAAAFGIN